MDSVPTVPTNVSAFTNDAGYLTSFTEQQVLSLSHDTLFLTGGSFVKLPAGFDGDYNSLTNKPTISTVPTNVSAFTNDAGYLTGYTETDPQFNAWDKDYNDLINTPTIPTVPTNVSAFTNDAGYLTSFTEQQVLSLSHDTLFLTGGSFVKLPAGFDGDYNSLTNKPELFSGDYNDLENVPQIPQIPADVSVFNNDAGYITEASCNGMNICEMFNGLEALQSQVDSLQQSLLLPETQVLLPIVVTTVVSDSVASFPTYGGNVTSDGGSVVSAKGVCWNTTGTPTISDNHTIDGGGVGSFLSNLQALNPNTVYFVRAYATNSLGTAYGEEVTLATTFTCGENLHYGNNTYTTHQYDSQCWMTQNLRKANGSESFNWGDAVCPAGWHLPSNVEWLAFSNYVNSSSQDNSIPLFFENASGLFWMELGLGVGFTCDISGYTISLTLDPFSAFLLDEGESSNVHVRCVKDEEEVEEPSLPTVTTAAIPNIATKTITCGGEVTSDGGYVVVAKGVCWNTTGTPTISDNHTIDGGGVGSFIRDLQALRPGTTYYLRAYATNSEGTGYGNEVSFTIKEYQAWDSTGRNPNDALPCQDAATVTDHEGNIYNTVQIGNQCWMRENMRCTTSPSTGTTILEYPASSYSYTGKKAYYVDGSAKNTATYGLLYNWCAAVDTFNTVYGETSTNTDGNLSVDVTFPNHRRGICPAGWHVPSDEEWRQLLYYVYSQNVYTCVLDSDSVIAKALASTIWYLQQESDVCAVGHAPSTNNITGFSIVPSGYYSSLGYGGVFWSANIWTSTQSSHRTAYDRWIDTYEHTFNWCGTNAKSGGYSVRCLRD